MAALSGPVVYLHPRRAKPLFLRHPWVFSGAAARVEGSPAKGDLVAVADANGKFIARGFYNADSQILVRLLTWDADEAVDDAFWRRRLEAAVRLRHDVLKLPESANAYRLVFSESDGLPGLIVDRYADFLVVQFLAAGMAAQQERLLDLLMEMSAPRGIYDRSDDESAEKEGIPASRGVRRGVAPQGPVEISIRRMKFLADIAGGQKTGFFLDQSENRVAAAEAPQGPERAGRVQLHRRVRDSGGGPGRVRPGAGGGQLRARARTRQAQLPTERRDAVRDPRRARRRRTPRAEEVRPEVRRRDPRPAEIRAQPTRRPARPARLSRPQPARHAAPGGRRRPRHLLLLRPRQRRTSSSSCSTRRPSRRARRSRSSNAAARPPITPSSPPAPRPPTSSASSAA